jgi:hypothetical protein
MASVFDRFLVLDHARIVGDPVDHSRNDRKKNELVHANLDPKRRNVQHLLLLPPHGSFGHSLIFQFAFFHNARVGLTLVFSWLCGPSLALWLFNLEWVRLGSTLLLAVVIKPCRFWCIMEVRHDLNLPSRDLAASGEISCPVTPGGAFPSAHKRSIKG